MEKLKRLNSEALDLVTESFRKGESELPQEVRNRTEDTEIEFEKERLNEKIDEVMEECENPSDKPEMDRKLAPVIHDAIHFENQRQAADPGVWNYLSVVMRPDYVRERWGSSKTRFISTGNLKRHSFGWLWWVAEITTDETGQHHEKALDTLLEKTDLTVSLFEREFSNYRKVAIPFINLLGDEKMEVWRETSKELNQRLSTVVLEDLSKEEIRDLIQDSRETVKNNIEE